MSFRTPDEEAIHKSVLENPYDNTPRLVLADYLDEHENPDEAAFHRAMADWMNSFQEMKGRMGTNTPWGRWHKNNEWGMQYHHLPSWVKPGDFYIDTHGLNSHSESAVRTRPIQVGRGGDRRWGLVWRNYEGMEGAFRRAFIRKRQQQRMSRLAVAVKYAREQLGE